MSDQPSSFQFKNQWLAIIAMALPLVIQYLEPAIDHALGRDQEQIQLIRNEIQNNRNRQDSLWNHGVERMMALDTGLTAVKIFIDSKAKTEGNETYAIGLRGKHGTDSLWYRASNGKIYDVRAEPQVMWWRYRDGFDDKAVFHEIDWDIWTLFYLAQTGQLED